MQIKDSGKVTMCMNPQTNCPNIPDPVSAYVVVYKGKPLVLCATCGPQFQLKVLQEKG